MHSEEGGMYRVATALALVLVAVASVQGPVLAGPPTWEFEFSATAGRTDRPVEEGAVDRTWIWGPVVRTISQMERYDSADLTVYGGIDEPGVRPVQYYEKARMEWNPDAPKDSTWRVTTGLLATELITGQMQVGDATFEDRAPAEVPVAGDPDSTVIPTYAELQSVLDVDPLSDGTVITATLDAEGNVGANESYADFKVTAMDVGSATGHTVASVFWEFMTSEGRVFIFPEGVSSEDKKLFETPFYATGYPITEAYWTRATVAGEETDVLLQCFQRRCLTYTPDNPENWQVEMGNIGRHYYEWRYGDS